MAQIQMYPRFAFDLPTSVRSLAIYESSLETGENKKIRIHPKLQRVAGGRSLISSTDKRVGSKEFHKVQTMRV